jgi:sugar lactone lactonase YvrE
MDPEGLISTIAGNGNAGFGGDGGAPTNASLYDPKGVALDASGNLYIADSDNARIRKVLLYAGHPEFTLKNVSALNAGNYSVVIASPYGSVTSAVATLTVQGPPIITAQPTNEIVLAGSSASLSVSVAGSGPFGCLWYFAGTNLLESGPNSTLTVADFSTNDAGGYTVVVTNAWGSVTSQVANLTIVFPPSITIQQGSQTVLAGSNVSLSVAVEGTGPFSYQWQFNGTDITTNTITTVAGNGSAAYLGDGGAATNASLSGPLGLALDAAGDLYISDAGNDRIQRVDTNGIITNFAGNGTATYSGDGGAATNAGLDVPYDVALDALGNLYFADMHNLRIRKVGTNGIISTVAGNGSTLFSGVSGAATNTGLPPCPISVALDASGNLYFTVEGLMLPPDNLVCEVGTNGILTIMAGNGSMGYSGDGGAATDATLSQPIGLASDGAGNLYVADNQNQRIRKVGINGIITTVAGKGTEGYSGDGGAATNATLNSPSGIALDAMGNLYIADSGNSAIRKLNPNGIITTVAGNGSAGYSGDGGAATNASLKHPEFVAVDSAGNLYIADTMNDRVRKVNLSGSPVMTLNKVSASNAGNYAVVVTSPYASVTTTVATLTVTIPPPPPQIITCDGFSAC